MPQIIPVAHYSLLSIFLLWINQTGYSDRAKLAEDSFNTSIGHIAWTLTDSVKFIYCHLKPFNISQQQDGRQKMIHSFIYGAMLHFIVNKDRSKNIIYGSACCKTNSCIYFCMCISPTKLLISFKLHLPVEHSLLTTLGTDLCR